LATFELAIVRIGVAVVGVCLLLAVSAPSSAVSQSGATEEVVVVYDGAVNEAAISATGGTITGGHSVDTLPVRFATVPEGARAAIEAHPAVKSVERDQSPIEITQSQTTPWGIDRIEAPTAAATVGASNQSAVQVAVVDTGIDYDHPDLAPNVQWGVNTVGSEPSTTGVEAADDDNGHGTHIAGTIGALDNDFGVVGVAPKTNLYAVKALDSEGVGSISDFVQGLDRAVKGPDGTIGTADDPDVVSMSLGVENDSRAIREVIDAATEYTTLVAAVGNVGDNDSETDEVQYPAKYDDVIAVAATNSANETTSWSSDGSAVEIAAPGVDIRSTYVNDTYAGASGTSMATPHVAGALALAIGNDLADGNRSLTDTEIRSLLHATADDIEAPGRDRYSGYGIVQADELVQGRTVELALSINETTPTIGQRVSFTVTRKDTGNPVAANVTLDNTTLATGDDGRVEYVFDRSDTYTVAATKSDSVRERYQPASATVTVEKRSVGLVVTADPTTPVTGEQVTFGVTRVDTGEPVAANVTVDNTTLATGDDGRVSYAFEDADTYTALVTKSDSTTETFIESSLSLTVTEREQDGPIVVGERQATDPDGDGLFEDVNGDGRFDIVDVNALYRSYTSSVVELHAALFDFDSDGTITSGDVSALFQRLRQR
jgi:subtilisin family serine protease